MKREYAHNKSWTRDVPEIGDIRWFSFKPGLVTSGVVRKLTDSLTVKAEDSEAVGLSQPETGDWFLWVTYTPEGRTIRGRADKKWRPLNSSLDLSLALWAGCYAWLDEPYSFYFTYSTLQQALRATTVAPRRERSRAHKRLRAWRKLGLAWDGASSGAAMPRTVTKQELDSWPDKKVWVKRK